MSENEGNRLLDWSSSRRHIEINLSVGHKTKNIQPRELQMRNRIWRLVPNSSKFVSFMGRSWWKLSGILPKQDLIQIFIVIETVPLRVIFFRFASSHCYTFVCAL